MTANNFSWQGRKVFLTGHTGFKGGWLALWLASKGASTRGYALSPATDPNLFAAARIGRVVDDIRGDIRDAASLESAMQSFAPEVVFHLAAQPLVRLSYDDPIGTYETNVIGTARVLCALRRAPPVPRSRPRLPRRRAGLHPSSLRHPTLAARPRTPPWLHHARRASSLRRPRPLRHRLQLRPPRRRRPPRWLDRRQDDLVLGRWSFLVSRSAGERPRSRLPQTRRQPRPRRPQLDSTP